MAKKKSTGKKSQPIEIIEAEVLNEEELSKSSDDIFDIEIDPELVDTESDEDFIARTSQSAEEIIGELDAETKALTTSSSSLTTGDPFMAYLQEVQRYPLLTKEQEYDLAVHYKETGDAKAAEKLITSNLRFVIKIAAEYSKVGSKMIDLVQEGNVGLMHAVKEYNPYKGVRLISYAVWWIRGYIKEFLMRQQSLVRIGTNTKQKRLYHQLRREQKKLETMGIEPDVKLLSSSLGVSEIDVTNMQQRLMFKDMSLDAQVGGEGNTSVLDLQIDEDENLQDDQLNLAQNLTILGNKIEALRPELNEKEIYLLDHRILADLPKTLQEVGNQFSISRERARQLEARVIKKLGELVIAELSPDTSD
ncbi:MAG: RNA polymerase factor sigma-32 [Bdellovibrionales bacterium]